MSKAQESSLTNAKMPIHQEVQESPKDRTTVQDCTPAGNSGRGRYETRYSYDADTRDRIMSCLVGSEKVSNFVQRAVEERLVRLEAREGRRRREDRLKDLEYVKGLVEEILLSKGVT